MNQRKKRNRINPLFQRRMTGKMNKKLAGLFVGVVLALVALAVRITVISSDKGEQYSKQVLSQSQQQYGSSTIPFKRGDIVDANGTILATSEKVYNLIFDCKVANDKEYYREPTITALTKVLGQDRSEIEELLDSEETKNSQYIILETGLSIEDKKAFEAYMEGTEDDPLTDKEALDRNYVKGIWFEDKYVRQYPLGSVACDVLGFTYDGNEAAWGLEGYYSNVLNGVDGRQYGYFNENAEVEQTIIQPIEGNSIVTTIDANIQQIVEKYIDVFETNMSGGPDGDRGAKNVGVIVMNPNNGEILAMASNDPYDLNNPRDLTQFFTDAEIEAMDDDEKIAELNKIWRNYCISEAFEPGSTVKPIVVAAALGNGTLNGDETFECDGSQIISGETIRCSNRDGHGQETLSDVIADSCNDGMMQLAETMGAEEFVKYQKLNNFGSKTGIDLSGEASGILYSVNNLGSVELATSSFGQGFTCTMIQEAAAMAATINGGYYYKPHLVSKVVNSSGTTVQNMEPVLLKQTVSSEVSSMIRSYMKACIDSGTGKYAKVEGYSMGGKTGTAQKIPRGNGKYLVSFIGFAPANNPEVLIYVVVDEPNTDAQDNSRYPQEISYNIMSELLPYLNVFQDEGASVSSKPTETIVEGTSDVNVPEPMEDTEEITGGNRLEDDGVTNDEMDLY